MTVADAARANTPSKLTLPKAGRERAPRRGRACRPSRRRRSQPAWDDARGEKRQDPRHLRLGT